MLRNNYVPSASLTELDMYEGYLAQEENRSQAIARSYNSQYYEAEEEEDNYQEQGIEEEQDDEQYFEDEERRVRR